MNMLASDPRAWLEPFPWKTAAIRTVEELLATAELDRPANLHQAASFFGCLTSGRTGSIYVGLDERSPIKAHACPPTKEGERMNGALC